MTASTDALRSYLVQLLTALNDNMVALAGGAQSSSPRLSAEASRFTKVATAADSCQLPNLGTQEAQGLARIVINDTANALAVFPAAGESINALGANTALSIPAGQCGIFFPSVPPYGGGATAIVTNWRAAVIP